MARSKWLGMAVALTTGAIGCAHCSTCDDFPTSCAGGGFAPTVAMAPAPMGGPWIEGTIGEPVVAPPIMAAPATSQFVPSAPILSAPMGAPAGQPGPFAAPPSATPSRPATRPETPPARTAPSTPPATPTPEPAVEPPAPPADLELSIPEPGVIAPPALDSPPAAPNP